jgi:hypothetical protein
VVVRHHCFPPEEPADVTDDVTDEPLTCSAKGCAVDAVWALLWNNPKLHTPDRRKTWLACDEHRTTLGDFLGARGFLRDVVPVEESARPPS